MADWLGDYVTVNERVIAFWRAHPGGRITTELVESPDGKEGRFVVKASVWRSADDPAATGYSMLNAPSSSNFQKGSELENAETSAVGRALGFLGFGITKSIASADEVAIKADPKPDGSTVTGFIEKWSDDGFAMKAGSTRYHVVSEPLTDRAFDIGDKVKVTGLVELVPWMDKSGKKMPPYKRLTASAVENGGS